MSAVHRGKTIVFIDNSNVFHGCKAAGWRIDPKKLISLIEKRGPIWQVFFFASASDPPRLQQTSFYKLLKEQLHFETIILGLSRRNTKCSKCGATKNTYTEKGVDVALATRMLSLANTRTFETAILVSGDKDYLETIRTVKAQGMRVEIYSWKGALSRELGAESSSDVIYLDDHKDNLRLTGPTDEEAERLIEPD